VRLLRSAGRGLRGLALALGLLGLIGGLSLLVALPLWWFCTRWPRAFTVASGGLLAAGLAWLLARRLQRASRAAGGLRPWWRRRFLPGLRTAGLVLASLGAVYGIALAAARIFR
jgi:hypothetical protein